jgi:hypothetical protein
VAGPLLAVYLLTGAWTLPYQIDALTNALTAWSMGTKGVVVLNQHEDFAGDPYFGTVAWIVDSPIGPVAQYPPGAALIAAPLYAIGGGDLEAIRIVANNRPDLEQVPFPVPPLWPATLAAAVSTAVAAGVLGIALRPLLGRRWAIGVSLGFGLATAAWSIASEMLWSHGPGLLWVAAALLFASRDRLWLSGAALGAATLTRPHLVVIAFALGLTLWVVRRHIMPAVRIGVGAASGLLLLVLYNFALFDRLTVTGGYGSSVSDQLMDTDLLAYLANVWGALFDISHGLIVWAPFLLILLPGIPSVWRQAPDWVKGAAIGGVVYLLVQLKANRFSGGEGHFGYRYPLEALMAAAPLLALSAQRWAWPRALSRKILLVSTALAALAQGIAVVADIRVA